MKTSDDTTMDDGGDRRPPVDNQTLTQNKKIDKLNPKYLPSGKELFKQLYGIYIECSYFECSHCTWFEEIIDQAIENTRERGDN